MASAACYLLQHDHAVRANVAEVDNVAGTVQSGIGVVYGDCNGSKADVRSLVRDRNPSDGITLIAVVVSEKKSALRTLVEAYAYVVYAFSHSRRKPVGQNLVDHLFTYAPTAGWR